MSLRRQRGLWLGVAAIMVILGGLVTAGVGPAVGAAAPQLTAARSIPGLNALNAGGNARVNSVSCGTPGTCVAAGSYTDTAGNLLPFVADETNGTWGQANSVAGIPELNLGKNAGATSISCAAPGSCSASGSYTDAHGDHPSWISYVNSKGFWNPALAEPGTSGGGLLEVGAPPQITVSCGAPGNCAAAGWTDITPTRARTSFLVDEVNFTWSASHDVPGLAALTGASGFSRLTAVSCKSAGNCTAAGEFSTSLRGTRAFAASEVNGTWGNAIEVPGIAALGGGTDAATARVVSCASAGNCAAGGVYDDSASAEHVFVAVQAGGAWASAQQLTGTGTRPTLTSASCATPGNCAFGGSGTDASGHVQGFVADLSAAAGAAGQIQTATSLALSAATVTFGQEQAGQISVKVTAASGGTPRGVVTVTAGKATVCLVILGSGTSSCRLTPKGLRPGSYALTARFLGGPGFAGSVSVPVTLTVTR